MSEGAGGLLMSKASAQMSHAHKDAEGRRAKMSKGYKYKRGSRSLSSLTRVDDHGVHLPVKISQAIHKVTEPTHVKLRPDLPLLQQVYGGCALVL